MRIVMQKNCAPDLVDDMKQLLDKQVLAQKEIKNSYGWDSQLGFNYSNGVLTDVTVVFSAEDVRNEPVGRLEDITVEVVSKVL